MTTEEVSKQVITRVTKEKHPGRIQSGKRLAEWNKQNKEQLLKQIEDSKNKQELNQEP